MHNGSGPTSQWSYYAKYAGIIEGTLLPVGIRYTTLVIMVWLASISCTEEAYIIHIIHYFTVDLQYRHNGVETS